MLNDLDAWFVREILVHERALAGYLQRCWPHRDELHDLRQEVYARVYEAARRERPASPRAFLFATARHLMTDRVRRSRVVSIEPMGDFESSNVYPIDELCPERWTGGRQALRRLVEALDALPDRCREVVWLHAEVHQETKEEITRGSPNPRAKCSANTTTSPSCGTGDPSPPWDAHGDELYVR